MHTLLSRPLLSCRFILLASAAVATAGCYEIAGGLLEDPTTGKLRNPFKGHAKLIPCSLPDDNPARYEAPDEWLRALTAYGGASQSREEVSVLVIRRSSGTTRMYATAVDGREEAWVQEGDGKWHIRFPADGLGCPLGVRCDLLAVLPGGHEATLEAIASEVGKKASRIPGRVRFSAEAGGLYSIQACQADVNGGPVFWVRDEHSLKCVSTECPDVQQAATGGS
jgi:hypothetical protein